jgi:hypothetical protein
MTNQEFIHEMQPIIKIFGPAEYAPDRMMLIFEDVSDLPASSLRWIVKMFCKDRSVKHPPLPKDFNTAAQEQRKKLNEFKVNDLVEAVKEEGDENVQNILETTGANSLTEAIGKFKLITNDEKAGNG